MQILRMAMPKHKQMSGHAIIVVGASAGGVEAVIQLVQGLPKELPAAILVVIHFPAHGKSILPYILTRSGPLQAVHATDGEAIQPGRIYLAVPDKHLGVKLGYIRLDGGPKENSARPAINVLFRTAAQVYGSRVIGVVLSGTLSDGTAGLSAIKRHGGVAIVQNPDEALFSEMPRSAIKHVDVDHILPVSEIASVLASTAINHGL